MSLIVYGQKISDDDTQSIVLQDPGSRSLVVMNKESGEISLLRQIRGPHKDTGGKRDARLISSYFCPQCGSEIGTGFDLASVEQAPGQGTGSFVHENYFKLLERRSSQTQLPSIEQPSVIPSNLFTPGYYRRFFKELSLLGSGARGSVYKVEHVLMDNHLGVYALKKIHIGNNLVWLERGMKEVKFLSALTHSSLNLITYNHVWLEMDNASGYVKTRDGKDTSSPESVPCVFILQQFCSGGNLEEVVLDKVFEKFTDHESPEERKKRFRLRKLSGHKTPRLLGLNSRQILCILHDVASGLKELHDLNIIHRDLKPSNCLLLEKFEADKVSYGEKDFPTVVISDFGESQLGGQLRSATGATGTLEFTAPEVVITSPDKSSADLPQFTFQSDMYSLGMVCYFLVFGELPFACQQSLPELRRDIKELTVNKQSLIEKHRSMNLNPLHDAIFGLMDRLLCRDPFSRPTAGDVKIEINRILESLPKVESNTHIDVEDVLPEDECDSLPGEPIQSPRRPLSDLKQFFCASNVIANGLVAMTAVWASHHGSYIPYACMFLFGLSLKSNQSSQKVYFIAEVALLMFVTYPTLCQRLRILIS